jgi:hypothetical protein
MLGYTDRRKIYEEWRLRTKIIKGMVTNRIFDYPQVVEVIRAYQTYGLEGLWFSI